MIRLIFIALFLVNIVACKTEPEPGIDFNRLAEQYVRLALTIGQYDGDFVDAYYGPDSLKPVAAKRPGFPKDSLLNAVYALQQQFKPFLDSSQSNDSLVKRARWISGQLTAFAERIRIFSGSVSSFNEESKQLFGVEPPVYSEDHFKSLVSDLNRLLPGQGSIPERMQQLSKKFIIPKDKVDTVFKAAIEEARRRTRDRYKMPSNESFLLEYVTDKPWGGYNWYKGNYQSVIQINLDLPILIDRAIDLACHEGYPGHHVYNMMLEKNLYRTRGWVEISLYPLYSPQSLIAEGSANLGIEIAFPGTEGAAFAKKSLVPLAGLDTAQLDLYFETLSIKSQLNYARNEAARGLLNGTIDEKEAVRWLTEYALMSNELANKSISFIRKNRSYVICYNYGQDLVRNYIEANGGVASAPAKRWELFGWLLSNPVTPADLLTAKKQ